MRIKSFMALRPPVDLVEQVSSPPYDVVNRREAVAIACDNASSFLHVIRPEIDLPEETPLYDDTVYEKADENFQLFRANGYLVRDEEDSIYVYGIRLGDHLQVGVVAVSHVDDYDNDLIKKHEKTRRATEDDRTRHVATLSAHAGPIFLTYRDSESVDAIVEQAMKREPLYDFTAPDGVQHTLWKVPGGEKLIEAFAEVPVSYVADGHHRSASAARVAHERREANRNHTGEEEYNWFMTVLFPASQLKVLPYNRCVQDLNGLSKEQFLERLRATVDVTESGQPSPSSPTKAGMYLDGSWYGLSWSIPEGADPVNALDVSALQDRILSPILGIDDPREDARIQFVGGVRGAEELERRVDTGEAAVAFSMYPTTVEQLMAIADAGQIMPPKSTWFEPKLRSGLLVHTFD